LANSATQLALNICRYCPVRDLCLDYAIQHKENQGIWGGLLPAARQAYANQRRRAV
jgi:WhiB family redox-sensing transcriptional regulator